MVECYNLFQEAVNHITPVDWLSISKIGELKKAKMGHYGMDIPAWTKHLHVWGEVDTVKTGKIERWEISE